MRIIRSFTHAALLIQFLFLVEVHAQTVIAEPPSLKAHYTRLPFDDHGFTGNHADIVVELPAKGRFIFSREFGYQPFWVPVGGGQHLVARLIPRKGDGPELRPTPALRSVPMALSGPPAESKILAVMEKNLDKYERIFFTMLSSGAQVWIRGHRLYDGPQSQAMLKKWMAWYKKYYDVIHGDIIHLKRPDGRGLDYTLHVSPNGKHKGMLLVFNPLDQEVTKTLNVPLYYTGATGTAKIREAEGPSKPYQLDGASNMKLPVTLPANGYSWFIIE